MCRKPSGSNVTLTQPSLPRLPCVYVLHPGIKAVWELAQDIERLCGPGRIRMLDIGGGLSVDYSTDEPPQVQLYLLPRP